MSCKVSILAILSFCFILFAVVVSSESTDFYALLGIPREANNREIRRAFKNLALIYHPDKNKDDAAAHEKFVKINRAYEVLKDEELRKKYDLFGEEGIKDGAQGGQNFQSWNFYKNQFGIYDEDTEIVTLSRADFEQAVLGGRDRWFVNFYSTQCSHCHELAPAWRQLARELEGVIRIGAINCMEDFMLCQEQGIFGYPSLMLFPEKDRYEGPRTKEDMMEFTMKRIKTTVFKVTKLPTLIRLLVDFVTPQTRRNAPFRQDGLVNVGSVDCVASETLCEKMKIDEGGVYYFDAGKPANAKAMNSLDPKELAFATLELLPDMVELTAETFKQLRESIETGIENPWLIQFVAASGQRDLELRKLPALLNDVKVGRVNCSRHTQVCDELHIKKHPLFAVFKKTGGYEIHHGRLTAHDLATFAHDCVETNVRVLGPTDFPKVTTADEAWYIDFFTPWCPPCMKLLPEFRKAAKALGGTLRFGTVDCTVHQPLCQQMNVHSYPTTILYNQSQSHPFVGLHGVDEILSFVEDVRHPPVVELTASTFSKLVLERTDDQMWVVDFFAPWCGPCQQLAPEFRKVAKSFDDASKIKVGSVDCTQHYSVCQEQGIAGYPTIRLYPLKRTGWIDYQNWFRDAFNIKHWIAQYVPSKVAEITTQQEFFAKVLDAERPWLLDFFAPWCGHCQVFAPEFERIAQTFEKTNVRLAKVNCDRVPSVCQTAGVRAYPAVKLYVGAKGGLTQNAYGHDVFSQSAAQIIDFVRTQLGDSLIADETTAKHDEL